MLFACGTGHYTIPLYFGAAFFVLVYVWHTYSLLSAGENLRCRSQCGVSLACMGPFAPPLFQFLPLPLSPPPRALRKQTYNKQKNQSTQHRQQQRNLVYPKGCVVCNCSTPSVFIPPLPYCTGLSSLCETTARASRTRAAWSVFV